MNKWIIGIAIVALLFVAFIAYEPSRQETNSTDVFDGFQIVYKVETPGASTHEMQLAQNGTFLNAYYEKSGTQSDSHSKSLDSGQVAHFRKLLGALNVESLQERYTCGTKLENYDPIKTISIKSNSFKKTIRIDDWTCTDIPSTLKELVGNIQKIDFEMRGILTNQ